MKFRVWACALACLCGLWTSSALAQTARQADFIVAVVNSEPITNSEVELEVQRLVKELTQQRQTVPPAATVRSQVLDRLISDRAQLQLAQEMGLRIDDAAVDQAEQTVASQNQIDVAELRRRVAKDGMDAKRFREKLREQLLLSRLHEREVESRIRVSDADVERAMAERLAENADPFAQDINLAQILVAVPEKASTDQAAAIYIQAQRVLDRIRAGESFDKLVEEVSAADRTNGGQLGARRADRYPPAFVMATQKLGVGEVSDIVRSGAGFHILKVIEKRAPTAYTQSVVQSHARHILLRPTPQLTPTQAQERLVEYKRRIESGAATFQALAIQYSQDGSAPQGGDLGWANPGMYVPEFEEVMNRLPEGQISNPVVTRFGVHLIQMLERRRIDLSPRELKELVRNQLREARFEEAFSNWAREVRGRAFVELRENPP
jgi:peptidyl-prolyl cis-trans isomerase SurA